MAFQVSVFIENKIGHFRQITSVLSEAGVNIHSSTLSTTTMGWGILNLIVNKPLEAEAALKATNHPVALRSVIALAMEDNVGGLETALAVMDEAQINIETAYCRNRKSDGMAVLIVDVNDIDDAESRLRAKGAHLLTDEEVYSF